MSASLTFFGVKNLTQFAGSFLEVCNNIVIPPF